MKKTTGCTGWMLVAGTVMFSWFPLACQDEGDGSDVDTESDENPSTDFELDAGPDGGGISQVSVEIHPSVRTIPVVRWEQESPADLAWLEFTFENDEWAETPPKPAGVGEHREVILGVPERTEVTFHVVTETGGEIKRTPALTVTNGTVPSQMPRATIISYNPELASPERWMLGSVERSPKSANQVHYYYGSFWIYIIDRLGRIVWYYSDLGDNPCMAYPRVSHDGSFVTIEKRYFDNAGAYDPRILKMTLDYAYFEEIYVPYLDDCYDWTDDGSLLFNTQRGGGAFLKEMWPDGTIREIWDVAQWAKSTGAARTYSNTIAWNRAADTITMSFPYDNTVVEVDRQTGELLGQFGDLPSSWSFDPPTWEFEFNHFANITPQGTLLVSSHMPGYEVTEKPVAFQHAFMEFEIDRQRQTLVEKWIYREAAEWAMFKGGAVRLDNGNTLANYGTGGTIREIAPDKTTVWHVKWDADFDSAEFFNNMVGHTVLLSDLYALCNRPP